MKPRDAFDRRHLVFFGARRNVMLSVGARAAPGLQLTRTGHVGTQ